MDLTDIHRAFHSPAKEYSSFPTVYGTFSMVNYMLEIKAYFDKYKKINITSSIFYVQNGIQYKSTVGEILETSQMHRN